MVNPHCMYWRYWRDDGEPDDGYCHLGLDCRCEQNSELDNYAYWRSDTGGLLTFMAIAYGVAATIALVFFYWEGYLR